MFKKTLTAIITATAIFGLNTNAFATFTDIAEYLLPDCPNGSIAIYKSNIYNGIERIDVFCEKKELIPEIDNSLTDKNSKSTSKNSKPSNSKFQTF